MHLFLANSAADIPAAFISNDLEYVAVSQDCWKQWAFNQCFQTVFCVFAAIHTSEMSDFLFLW